MIAWMNTSKKFALLLSFLVCVVGGGEVAEAEHYKVFILGGQSNMYGADSKTEALPEDLQKRQEDVLLYSGSEFSKLKPGSGRSFGPEVTFGRAIADALPHENFYLIKHSDGGTSLWNEWNLEDGRSYTRLRHVVEKGLETLTKAGHSYEIVGILWTQGERDAWNLRTTEQYESDLQAFIADLRSRYGEDLPFFFSRLSPKQTARPIEAVRLAQDYVADADPNAYLIDTDAMEMQRDNLHFTGQGYIDLGLAFAQAYLNTRSNDNDTTKTDTVKPTAPSTQPATSDGVISGDTIIVNTSDGSLSFTTFDRKGHPAWHPQRTVDGSGLTDGVHRVEKHTGWMTERIDSPHVFIQWDLGASYRLDSIHVWNLRTSKDNTVGVRSVDVFFSNVPFPGDPEKHEAANWTRWGDGPIELPQAPEAGEPNTGFDLAKVAGRPLPDQPVRYLRFEVNTNWKGGKHHFGLAEIQFKGQRVTPSLAEKPGDAQPSDDTTAPTLKFQSPLPNATGINPQRDLILVFDEPVTFGTGSITLKKDDGSVVQTFDVTSPGDGLNLIHGTLTIRPETPLDDATTYHLEIDDTAIADMAGNAFAGLDDASGWSFTTVVPDVTPPTIVTRIPDQGQADFFPADNLVLTFSENIGFDEGAIHIRKADGTVVESFEVTNPPQGLSYLGNVLTINPTQDLPLGTSFDVEIEPTAIRDNAGNHFPGTGPQRTWSFATPATATYAAITYVGTQFDIESTGNDPTVGWRNTTPKKPMDIDGDDILGTDGWRMGTVGQTVSDPPYLKTAKTAPNGNAHGRWDNPDDPSGDDTNQGVLHDSKAGTGDTTKPLVTFTITEDFPEDRVLRVGLLFDVQGGPNTATYTITQTFGGTATATTPVHTWTGERLDVAFFDLTDLRKGYQFQVTSQTIDTPNYPHAFEQLVGVTFDTGLVKPDESPSE